MLLLVDTTAKTNQEFASLEELHGWLNEKGTVSAQTKCLKQLKGLFKCLTEKVDKVLLNSEESKDTSDLIDGMMNELVKGTAVVIENKDEAKGWVKGDSIVDQLLTNADECVQKKEKFFGGTDVKVELKPTVPKELPYDEAFKTLDRDSMKIPLEKQLSADEMDKVARFVPTIATRERCDRVIKWFLDKYCENTPIGEEVTLSRNPELYWDYILQNTDEFADPNVDSISYDLCQVANNFPRSYASLMESEVYKKRPERPRTIDIGSTPGLIGKFATSLKVVEHMFESRKEDPFRPQNELRLARLVLQAYTGFSRDKLTTAMLQEIICVIAKTKFYKTTGESIKSSTLESTIKCYVNSLFSPYTELFNKISSMYTLPLFSKAMAMTNYCKARKSDGIYYLHISETPSATGETSKDEPMEILYTEPEHVDDVKAISEEELDDSLASYGNFHGLLDEQRPVPAKKPFWFS